MLAVPDAGSSERGPASRMRRASIMPQEKAWLDLRHHSDGKVVKPEELEQEMQNPPENFDKNAYDRIHGSMIGMALGDALGAHVEFRPHQFLVEHPVTDLQGGGTWGLKKGQFTDDTSMALCLASSLVIRQDYDPYDQLVRYKWWFRDGYLSSTGQCFDIGSATKQSLLEFERRQKKFAEKYKIPMDELDFISDMDILDQFDVKCSEEGVAGNGALMRLAPVPLFFYNYPLYAVEYSGHSGEITHGDPKAYDACRYYGALIVAAVKGAPKTELLSTQFYERHKSWFGHKELHPDIVEIAHGSYKVKKGYEGGIRGGGYIVKALQAALWAFCYDNDSFEAGVLAAINLGDDTDTTAAIYGQLAGAYYGYRKLPSKWTDQVYANKFIQCLSKWIAYEGQEWKPNKLAPATTPLLYELDGRTRRASISNTNSNLVPPDGNETYHPQRPRSSDLKNVHHQPQRIYALKTLQTNAEVVDWLERLGDQYKVYAHIFEERNVDGYWLLNQVDDAMLTEYGIQRDDHRHAVLTAINQLKKTCPTKYSTIYKT